MPKILMTSVREDEEAAIAAYAQQHQVEIDIARDELKTLTRRSKNEIRYRHSKCR